MVALVNPTPEEAQNSAPGLLASTSPAIEAIGLTRTFGRRVALRELTFQVRDGECLVPDEQETGDGLDAYAISPEGIERLLESSMRPEEG